MVISTPQRTANGMAVAAAAHAAVVAFLLSYTRVGPHHDARSAEAALSNTLTWLAEGPGGGRGGSGSHQRNPVGPLRRVGHDRENIASAPPSPTAPQPLASVEPDPIVRVAIPVTPLGSGTESMIGVIGAVAASQDSLGPGSGDRAGSGNGVGNGPGDGPESGVGKRGGVGDGLGGIGNNLTHPAAIYMAQPRYTNEAMRARVQGTVTVECVVRPSGVCTDIRVVRSLDRVFGLDEEAMRAVALWRFKPGSRFNQPVPVIVRIELEFTLR